jgi:Mycobacterium 19 kDa lipoprotein antigen
LAAAAVVTISAADCSSSTSGKAEGRPAGDSASAVGQVKVVVDGRPRQVTGDVVCVVGPTGELNITVGAADTTGPSPAPPPKLIADLTLSDGPPHVSLLMINLADMKLSIGRYRHVDQPTVTAEGKSYRIIGQAAVGDNPDREPEYKQFEVEVTCP